MAIPSTPQNFFAQTGNVQNLVSWNASSGATSYDVQRSIDGDTYVSYATPTTPYYLDTAVSEGSQYWYKIASVNTDGTSPYTAPQSVVPALVGEMSLGALRYFSQAKADRLNSEFVQMPEWNFFINLAMNELYDLLITEYEDYFSAPPVTLTTNGSDYLFDLPNGVNNSAAEPFYKLLGVDLQVNNASNGWVTMNQFNFIDRNQFFYPNSAGTIYGVFNMKYRLMGTKIQFRPTPSANQSIRLWYAPRLRQLLQDTDTTTIGFSGWLQYVIVRAAKYALDKEESDTSKLDAELMFLKTRIEESAMNRDAGQADTISDTRHNTGNDAGFGGFGKGGW